MNHLPFPSNQNEADFRPLAGESPIAPPWKRCNHHEALPMMFQIEFSTGESHYFAYSDLREARIRDAGYLQLGLIGMKPLVITIEGRNLKELGALLAMGLIKSVTENGRKAQDRPETSAAIDKIVVEALPGPGH